MEKENDKNLSDNDKDKTLSKTDSAFIGMRLKAEKSKPKNTGLMIPIICISLLSLIFLTPENFWFNLDTRFLLRFGIYLWGSELRVLLIVIFGSIGSLFFAIFMYKWLKYKDVSPEQVKHDYVSDLRKNLFAHEKSMREEQKDILELMLDNTGEIRDYYQISKNHAKNSFKFASISAFCGLVFLVVSTLVGFRMGAIQPAIITAIGGGIAEILAGLSLYIYKTSQEQLNHYYQALHENERYLSTVNLVSKLTKDKQDEAYSRIIDSFLVNTKTN